MEEGKASESASTATAHRFVHSLEPECNRIFYDPYAKHFLSRGYKFLLVNPFLRYVTARWYERLLPGIARCVYIRVRYIDDCLKECIDNGLEQLVVLGAGYDTRAYRFGELKDRVKVFEVDHPTTQVVKIEKVKNIFGYLPRHVEYVGVDFTKEEFKEKLIESGYDGKLRTIFIWEGVTYFMPEKDIDKTLSFVASNEGEGSSIVFDYVYTSALDSSCKKMIKVRHLMEKVGEPILFGIDEGQAESFLAKRGFYHIRDVKAQEYEITYLKCFRRRWGFMEVSPYWGFVYATVKSKDEA
ncbi:MAG: SAM-dependent methyltransferase [Chloroflexota bacterium]|nr:SAM-dependent methyltransferase [Chloroflexota bacterium]